MDNTICLVLYASVYTTLTIVAAFCFLGFVVGKLLDTVRKCFADYLAHKQKIAAQEFAFANARLKKLPVGSSQIAKMAPLLSQPKANSGATKILKALLKRLKR